MANSLNRSTEDWEHWIGEQCRSLRIAAGLDQLALADNAGISVGALKHLEGGQGCSLKTLIRTIRALKRTDWLESLAPLISISPLQELRSPRAQMPRRRVSRKRAGAPEAP